MNERLDQQHASNGGRAVRVEMEGQRKPFALALGQVEQWAEYGPV